MRGAALFAVSLSTERLDCVRVSDAWSRPQFVEEPANEVKIRLAIGRRIMVRAEVVDVIEKIVVSQGQPTETLGAKPMRLFKGRAMTNRHAITRLWNVDKTRLARTMDYIMPISG